MQKNEVKFVKKKNGGGGGFNEGGGIGVGKIILKTYMVYKNQNLNSVYNMSPTTMVMR